MALRPIVLIITVSLGVTFGWICGSAGGVMGSYLAGVLGASVGLYAGRKIQKNLDG